MLTVTVTGIGTARVAPDSAVVRLAALARGRGVAEAYQAMTAAATSLVEVAGSHTEERRIGSTGITVWPSRDHEGREVGYEARHSYAIECTDLPSAGAMLSELANTLGERLVIESVGLEVTAGHGAGDKAREAAFHEARDRAAQLARLSGAHLGNVQSIVEADPDPSGPTPKLATLRSNGGGLEPGEATVSVSVTVVWELTYA